MGRREEILTYINVDSFIEGQVESLRLSLAAQLGTLPERFEAALTAFKEALQRKRGWFEDQLAETCPEQITEEMLSTLNKFMKTELVQTMFYIQNELTPWVANLNAQWLRDPDIEAALKLLEDEAPMPAPAEHFEPAPSPAA